MGAFFIQKIEGGYFMEGFIARIAKLIDVKSIMTLSLTVGFLILVGNGLIDGDKFMTIYTMIVGFYFGVQSTKAKE